MHKKILILFLFVLTIVGCASQSFFGSKPVPKPTSSAVSQICFENKTSPKIPTSDQSRILIETERKFSSQIVREGNATEFIASLDRIIRGSEFSFLLQCKADWEKQKNHFVRVAFPKDLKNMELGSYQEKGQNSEVHQILEIRFWLFASVQQVLPTYMHELLHVCQHDKTVTIQKQFKQLYGNLDHNAQWTFAKQMWREKQIPPGVQFVEGQEIEETKEAYRAENRNRMLNEISAMLLMQKAYEYFVALDAGYCIEDSTFLDQQKKLALAYATGAEERVAGIFAQRVLSWYDASIGEKGRSEGLFWSESSEVNYRGSANGPAFKMKLLDPIFKKQIENLGIKVREGDAGPL